MIKVKAGNARNSRAIAKFSNAEIDYFALKLIVHVLIRGSLGHALYMKAIHGGKAKNDRIDSFKIANLMRGGNFPLAYVYPKRMRATRDLLRRRMKLEG